VVLEKLACAPKPREESVPFAIEVYVRHVNKVQ
jgi:hypothetical protein